MDRMVPSGTTGAAGTPSPPSPFWTLSISLPFLQLHLPACTGNWMRLKPRSWGKDRSIKNLVRSAWKPLPWRVVLPCPVLGLLEQRQQNQSQTSGAAPGGGEKIKGRKGPLMLHLEAGLKTEMGLRRSQAGALRGAFFPPPPFCFIIHYCY